MIQRYKTVKIYYISGYLFCDYELFYFNMIFYIIKRFECAGVSMYFPRSRNTEKKNYDKTNCTLV